MPKSQKKSKKSKETKHKTQTQTSLDEIEESLLLGEEDVTEPTAKLRKNSLETSLQEEELLNESPIVVKKSKRRRTRNSIISASKAEKAEKAEKLTVSELDKLTVSELDKLSVSELDKLTVAELDKLTVSELDISLGIPGKDDPISDDNLKSPTAIKPLETVVPDNIEKTKTKSPKETKTKSKNGSKTKSDKVNKPSEVIPVVESPKLIVADKQLCIKTAELEEVDIYSDLSTDNIEIHTPEGPGEEVTLDEVFKMNTTKSPEKPAKKNVIKHEILSENEDEDLDYEGDEKDISQMKISVLVGGSKVKKVLKSATEKPRPRVPTTVILPPLPHTHITIPPMLPLPPALPPPPRYCPSSYPTLKDRRTIYINPKFRTEVILKNLEEQGIIKGGTVAVHMNRSRLRSRSRSPIKLHTNFEYVPSPKQKQKVELDDPTTTLLITDLSVCTTKSRLRELFSNVGSVKEVLTYPSERRAVVTFQHAKDAVVCRRKFHRSVVDGSCMTVNFAI